MIRNNEFHEIRDFSTNYAAQALAFGVNAILGIAIFNRATTVLGPESYGKYALYGVAINLVAMLAVNWLLTGYSRFGREEMIKTGKLLKTFGNEVLLLSVSCGLGLLGIFLGRHRLAEYIGLGVDCSYMVMVFILLALASQVFIVSLKITGRFQRLALISPVQNVLFLIFLYLIVGEQGHVERFIFWSLLAHGCSILALAAGVSGVKMWPPQVDKSLIRPMTAFSSASFLWILCFQVIDSIDVIAIKAFLPIASVGIYNAAYRMMTYLWIIPQLTIALTVNLVVGFASKGRDDLVRIYFTRYARQGILGTALLTLVVMSLSREIFALLLNPVYHPGLVPFVVLMVSVSLRSVNAFLCPVINAYLLLKQYSLLLGVMAVVNIIGDWLTLNLGMGLMGPAVVTVSVFLIDALGVTWITGRRMGTRNEFHLLFALYPVLATPVALIQELGVRLGCLLILIVALLALAKRLGIFAESDGTLYEQIRLPIFVKNGLLRFLRAMG